MTDDMTGDASPAGPAYQRPAETGAPGFSTRARFEFVPPAGDGEPATVLAADDIDLTSVGQFQATLDQAALDQAAAVSGDVIADMTAVTYCDSATIRVLFTTARQVRLTIRVAAAGLITETLLKVSGLDQIVTVVTPD